MIYRRGFTLLEVLIAITIMTTLSTLMVIGLRSSQAYARDDERRADIASLARGLENYYTNGAADGSRSLGVGHYPGGDDIADAISGNYLYNGLLPGTTASHFKEPGSSGNNFIVANNSPSGDYTDTEARSQLDDKPYLYQPMTESGSLCRDWVDCTKFNLYYITETDNTVHIIRSKNQ